MRKTRDIDDPKWDDITDRDALIRKLAGVIRGELFEKDSRPDTILIDDTIEDALVAIGDVTSEPVAAPARISAPSPRRGEDWDNAPDGYTGTL